MERYPQSKVIEDYIKFKPNKIKELPQEVQTRLELTDGLPIEFLMSMRAKFLEEQEANGEFEPVTFQTVRRL